MDQQKAMPWGPPAQPTPQPPGQFAGEPITFSGNRPVFRDLVLRGGLLELLTVGFYRFWLATDIRRHLWSNTAAGGDRAEYDGRAKELLIGFLFAVAILAPIYLAYFLVGIEAERLQVFLSLPFGLFFVLFIEFARYRGRRYRVTRTIWRGIRFGMGGSGWSYAWRSLLWTAFASLTIGFAWGWRQAALERFKMRHLTYGGLEGSFEGRGGSLMARIWWMIPLAIVSSPLMIPLPFLYAAFRAIEWRWWVDGLRIGPVRFQSTLPAGALMGNYWKVIGWLVLFMIFLGAWVAGVFYTMSNILVEGGQMDQESVLGVIQHPATLIAGAFGYLLVAIALWMVARIYLVRDVWAKVAASTTVLDLGAANSVVGQGALVGSLGEGLSGGLDIGF